MTISRRNLLAAAAAGLALLRAEENTTMRIRFLFADQDFTATLEDTQPARELLAMLPLDLTITDYSTNEKIAYLPRKLARDGATRFGNEAPGDLCYYAPWGNLALFHSPYRWSRGLIRLGRLDGGHEPLLTRGEHPLRVEIL
ncbi:hypothetical protein ATH84_106318 [Paracoccus versutus]|uniref:Cyclophilin-like domain-containing protein n=1 Tax=Paracoccus versutus TaxID=34007 RepID=A0AAQ0HCU9_PARVE|nr:cyclophilin-like fold protein [Paracoccus versutus]REG28354.1 hypothetical protein ATH84_106318 [Paracoccus versutus]